MGLSVVHRNWWHYFLMRHVLVVRLVNLLITIVGMSLLTRRKAPKRYVFCGESTSQMNT